MWGTLSTTKLIKEKVQRGRGTKGQARRLKRIITVFRLAFCRALISEIQVFTVCCITPMFFREGLFS